MTQTITGSTTPISPQQEKLTTDKRSALSVYREFAYAASGAGAFAYYELAQLISANTHGLVGYGLRSILYPPMFKSCARRPAIGRGVTIRNPRLIELGQKVLIDDYSTLDVRGDGGIALGNFASVGRFSILVAKAGSIMVEAGVNIGSNCRIATQSAITIGSGTIIAAYTYIGPGNHQDLDGETPRIAQPMEIKGGVTIGKNVWIGARVTILDGVTIGDGATIGAHSLVRDNVPTGATVVGTPARVISTQS